MIFISPRTQNVYYLLLECQKIDKESFDIDLKCLADYSLPVRYRDDLFIPGIIEIKVYIQLAGEIFLFSSIF
jgi:hypothetical protein